MDEISPYNVPVKRRSSPKEASRLMREAMDETLSLALSLHHSSPLAFNAYVLFVLFPRLLLRPLPDGCQGSFAAAALLRRCNMLREGEVGTILNEAHEAHVGRVAKQTEAHSKSTSRTSFSKTARTAILAGARAMGRACKLAFSYGLESDPAIAAKFLFKLTLKKKHDHILEFVARVKPTGTSSLSRRAWMPSHECRRSQQPTGTYGRGSSFGTRPKPLQQQHY